MKAVVLLIRVDDGRFLCVTELRGLIDTREETLIRKLRTGAKAEVAAGPVEAGDKARPDWVFGGHKHDRQDLRRGERGTAAARRDDDVDVPVNKFGHHRWQPFVLPSAAKASPAAGPNLGRQERNFWMRRQSRQNRRQRQRTPAETIKGRTDSGNPGTNGLFEPDGKTPGSAGLGGGGRSRAKPVSKSIAEPKQCFRRAHRRGFWQNCQFEAVGFRFSRVLSVGFRAK